MQNNDPFSNIGTVSRAQSYDAGLRAYMLKIYNYMASALALTGIVALFASNSPVIMNAMYTTSESGGFGLSGLGWIVVFAPLAVVFFLSARINSMSLGTAQGVFWLYSGLVGLSLSYIFLLYTGASIARVFFITAGTFGAMSLYGYTTKKDLSGFGSFLIMGLFGLIIASIVNIFLASSGLQFAISVLGVLIFVGLTAYDTQKLKSMYYQVAGDSELMARSSIMGALNLYLDFINMFIYLLRFFGDRR